MEETKGANGARGLRIEGDDIIMYPERMLPPPHIRGHISEVRIEGENLVQVFHTERRSEPLRLPVKAANYSYHRGGTLRFGKLTITDADLEIIDQNPRTPFRLLPRRLQPAAGCRLFEKHTVARSHRSHAGLRTDCGRADAALIAHLRARSVIVLGVVSTS